MNRGGSVVTKVSEQINKQNNNIYNNNIWGDVMYNAPIYGVVSGGTNVTSKLQDLITLAISQGRRAIYFPKGEYYVTSLINADKVDFFGDNAKFIGGYTGTIRQMGDWATTEDMASIVLNVTQGEDIRDKFSDAYNQLPEAGGEIVIPEGEYYFSPLRIGDFVGVANAANTPIIAERKTIKIRGRGPVELKLPDESNTDMLFFRRHNKGITVENIKFNGNRDKQTGAGGWKGHWGEYLVGFFVWNSNGITLRNCSFVYHHYFGSNICADSSNVLQDGCFYEYCFTGTNHQGKIITLNNCTAKSCQRGLMFEGNENPLNYTTLSGNCGHIRVIDCFVSPCDQYGIYILNPAYDVLIDNCFVGNTPNAISVNSTGNAAWFSDNIKITKCTVDNASNIGIYLGSVVNARIDKTMSKINKVGLSVFKLTESLISGCDLSRNQDFGVYMSGANNNVMFADNVINNNNSAANSGVYGGMRITGANITVDGNKINDTTSSPKQNYAIILFENPTNVSIKNNEMLGNIRAFVDNNGAANYSWINNTTSDRISVRPQVDTYTYLNYVTTLPLASDTYRYSLIVLQQVNGSRDDELYMCVRTQTNTWAWKKVTMT